MTGYLDGEKVEFYAYRLKNEGYLGQIPTLGLKKFLSRGVYYELDSGYEMITEGSLHNDFFIILDGDVAISKLNPETQEKIEVGRLKSYNTVGEIGCILGHPRKATVTTLNPTKVLKYSDEEFQTLRIEIKGLESALITELAKRLESLY